MGWHTFEVKVRWTYVCRVAVYVCRVAVSVAPLASMLQLTLQPPSSSHWDAVLPDSIVCWLGGLGVCTAAVNLVRPAPGFGS